MQIRDLDEFKAPNRKPWLILLVILVVGGFFLYRYWRKGQEAFEEAPPPTASVQERVPPEESESLPPRKPAQPSPMKSADISQLVARGKEAEESGNLVEARDLYLHALGATGQKSIRSDVEDRLGRINTTLVMTSRPMPEKIDYVVESGDSLEKIASKYGTTVELIQESNGVSDPNRIRAGDRLRVFTGDFEIAVYRSQNELVVVMNDGFFKRYPVGTGKFGKTPLGTFKIVDKIKEPVWWRPDGKEVPYGDPQNILGTRWMSLRATGETPDVRGYGIHGTWDPASIGKAESAGCIRLKNEDVEELFTYIPLGTSVEIVE